MAVRLTKPTLLRKAMSTLNATLFSLAAGAAPLDDNSLRTCVAAARDAAAVTACELKAQAELRARIAQSSAAILNRLDARQRVVFERNTTAWEAYLVSETTLLDLTLAKRRDGLGSSLRPGAITQLYEARDRQLLEHLHNLSFSGDAGGSHTR